MTMTRMTPMVSTILKGTIKMNWTPFVKSFVVSVCVVREMDA